MADTPGRRAYEKFTYEGLLNVWERVAATFYFWRKGWPILWAWKALGKNVDS